MKAIIDHLWSCPPKEFLMWCAVAVGFVLWIADLFSKSHDEPPL